MICLYVWEWGENRVIIDPIEQRQRLASGLWNRIWVRYEAIEKQMQQPASTIWNGLPVHIGVIEKQIQHRHLGDGMEYGLIMGILRNEWLRKCI